jgi:hypothetical protein
MNRRKNKRVKNVTRDGKMEAVEFVNGGHLILVLCRAGNL